MMAGDLVHVWHQMRRRCNYPDNPAFDNYGGRGIRVCDRWESGDGKRSGFKCFLADMGERPEGGLLDRIDNNGPYSPENCRWATRKEQNSNRRNCIYVEWGGERVTLKEYCRRAGLRYRPIVKRIQDRNWPVEKALTTPLGSGKHFSRIPERRG